MTTAPAAVQPPGAPPARHRRGVLGQRDFRLLFAGDAVSQFGTQISLVALPLVAVTTLHATPFEVGALTAAETAAFLLVGLPAGAVVDRVRRRPVLVAGDMARSLLLASVPVAYALGVLTIWQLLVVALLAGLCTVFFDVAYQSYLPALVTRSELVEGNSRLESVRAVSQLAGPAAGGFLVQALTGPGAIALDAASYLWSGTCISRIRKPEAAPERPTEPVTLRADIREGLAFVVRHPLLRAIAATTGTSNLFSSVFGAVAVLFLVRELGLSAGAVGALFSGMGVGALIGSLIADRVARRLGAARAIWLTLLVTGPFQVLMPLTTGGWTLAGWVVAEIAMGIGVVVYNVTQVSFRQGLCPPRLLGRMNASIRFLVWGTMPIGGLLGGALGSWIGLRATLWVAVAGLGLSWLPVYLSPLRGMRELPAYDDGPAAASAAADPIGVDAAPDGVTPAPPGQ